MKLTRILRRTFAAFIVLPIAFAAAAADYPAPKEASFVAKDFRFHTGEVMPELRINYTHRRRADRRAGARPARHHRLRRQHADAGFRRRAVRPGPAARRQEVLHHPPGLARRRQVVEALRRAAGEVPAIQLRRHGAGAVPAASPRASASATCGSCIGNSMGGMHAWMWGAAYPELMDAIVPMASQPTEMSSRNWMMRRLMIETIRNDPDYNNGNYTAQPRAMRLANVFYATGTNGGDAGLPEGRADARAGRQAARRSAGGAVQRRRQRLHLSVGVVARLQPVAGPRAHRGRGARHQCGRRRAQPARDRHHGARAEAGEERRASISSRRATKRAATARPA